MFSKSHSISGTLFVRHFGLKTSVTENYVRCSRLLQPSSFSKQDAKQAPQCRSQKLMLDNGLIMPAGTGTFVLLPLATRSLKRLVDLIDLELEKVGGQKVNLPCLVPGHLLKTTGRWEKLGSELFQLQDRRGHDYCLGPTHEEAVTQLVASLQHLPLSRMPVLLYQIGPKFRDEARPKFGLLRCREFIMKDMYSFDVSDEDAGNTYDVVCAAYDRILQRLGVPYVKVKASTGTMGGNYSHEFHFVSDIGEDHLFLCPKCRTGVSADERNSDSASLTCNQCDASLEASRGIEVAHAFSLGTTYSEPLKASFVGTDGKHQPLLMNCFGIGVTRALAASLEILSTNEELRWPLAVAPFKVAVVTPKRGSREEAAGLPMTEHLAGLLNSLEGLEGDVLLDDRDSWTIGKRLKDLRNMGMPYIIVAGKKIKEAVPLFELHDTYNGAVVDVTQSDLLYQVQFGDIGQKISACS